MNIFTQISNELQQGNDTGVTELTREAIQQGITAKQILDEGLIAGMNVVGEQFRIHEIFLPEVLLAARAMYAGMDEIKPLLVKEGAPTRGKVVIGTVQGDLHDIGKNLVGIMLRGAGFEVIDLGNDVSPEDFVRTARETDSKIIGMSALLTTTMPAMKRTVEHLNDEGLTGKIFTIVGGAPVSEWYAQEIGADAYGFDGVSAVEQVRALIGELTS